MLLRISTAAAVFLLSTIISIFLGSPSFHLPILFLLCRHSTPFLPGSSGPSSCNPILLQLKSSILCLQGFILATVTCQNISLVRFDGFQVYRLLPYTEEQLAALQQRELGPDGWDFWSPPKGKGLSVDVMVPPDLKQNFLHFIKSQNLDAEVLIENVQERINNETPRLQLKSETFNWYDYYSMEMINGWMDTLTKKYSGIVTTIVGGKTYEGREIRGVRVSFGSGKRGVFLEGGIHAREWISPATVTYILNELLTSNDTSVRIVAEAYDWYVFPVVNPDGYIYTHTIDRLWRKTRKPYGKCYGADPNRNWNYHWKDGGTNDNPCSETFPGSSAFSEIETKSLSDYISTIAAQLDAYIGFHSYSQLLLLPFGHQGHEKPENNDELLKIGKAAVAKLAVRYGTHYKVGNIPETIYVGSGGSTDWVRGVYRHIRLAYTFELRDQGQHGFVLPKEQIKATGEETLDALVAMFQEVAANKL